MVFKLFRKITTPPKPTPNSMSYFAVITLICAELAGDFHLGYARQLTDKSSLLFDLAF